MSELDSELLNTLSNLRNADDALNAEKRGRKPKKAAATITEAVLGPNETHFSKIFGFTPPSRINHAVRVFDPGEWDVDVRCFIPEVDNNYVFPPEQTEAAVVAVMQGDPCLTVGPKGSGKTTLFQQICARINMPWIRVNHNLDMDSASLYGTPAVSPGHLGWNDGPLPLLAKHGGVMCSDEISSSPAGISMGLMAPLEKGGAVYVADKPSSMGDKYIKPHKWFRIVATDNTVLQGDTSGRYAGTNVQNEALVDRFMTVIQIDYLSREHETKVIKAHVNSVPDTIIGMMLDLASVIRTGYNMNEINVTMSPRGLVNWAHKIAYWSDPAYAFKISFFNKLTDDDKKRVSELYFKCFGENLSK